MLASEPLQRLPPLAERLAHARLDLLERAVASRAPELLAGALGEATAALVERGGEIRRPAGAPLGDAARSAST